MTVIGRVNDTLERVFGVRLLRTRRVDALKSKANAATTAEAKLRERDKRIEQLETKLGTKRKAPKLPDDYDAGFSELWESVRERTMTSHEKVYGLYQAVRYVVRHNVPGSIVECGVWRGGSMIAVASLLDQLEMPERDLYLFDTYEGMTDPTDRDVQIGSNKSAQERLDTADQDALVWAVASLEDVQRGFEQVRYPRERIHFVQGPVEETVPEQAPEQISILRLDTDWYESTRHELRHLYHRVAPGGVLIVDDYGTWQGSKDATDEFLAETDEPLLILRAGRSRIAVKPGLSTKIHR